MAKTRTPKSHQVAPELAAAAAITPEDIAIFHDVARRFKGFYSALDYNGTARVADRHAYVRHVTLSRIGAHDERFGHHSHLATDLCGGEALDNTPRARNL